MYENIVISKILDTRSIDILSEQGITHDMFLNSNDELDFILEHRKKYNSVPDHVTFVNKYPDFELYKSKEDDRYIATKLKDSYVYPQMYKLIQDAVETLPTNAIDTLTNLEDSISQIKNQVNLNVGRGADIVRLAKDRLDEIKRRGLVDGTLGITTGIELLDDISYGWLPNDYAVLFARSNQGKSWLSLFFGVKAWESGKKVVYYSGEMDKLTVGFRFDNLYRHFKNSQLMTGRISLEEYNDYIEGLGDLNGFICVEPEDFGGFASISDLEGVMKYHNADILIIDQLSLLKSKVSGSKTDRFASISNEIVLLNKRIRKPILLVAQANRNSEKNKKDDMDTPDLIDIESCDQVAQDASKVFSFVEFENVVKLSILKSRFGAKGRDVLLAWDKEEGYIKPLFEDGANTDDFGF